jgi:Slime mold cyclic AMP receptor
MKVKFHAVCWLLPLTLTLLPLIHNTYGYAGGWCWISIHENEDYGKMWRMVQFYAPLWITLIFNFSTYWRTRNRLEMLDQAVSEFQEPSLVSAESSSFGGSHHHHPHDATMSEDSPDTQQTVSISNSQRPQTADHDLERSRRSLLRMNYYPLALCVCFLLPTIDRVYQMVYQPRFELSLLQLIGQGSIGFVKAIVFFTTPTVQQQVRMWGGSRPHSWYLQDRLLTNRASEPTDPQYDSE